MAITKTKIRNVLIIINIIAFILLITLMIIDNNTLSLKSIEEVAISTFGKANIERIDDIGSNNISLFIIDSYSGIYEAEDYSNMITQFTDQINEYRPSKNIDRILLKLIDYEAGLEREYRIETLEFY